MCARVHLRPARLYATGSRRKTSCEVVKVGKVFHIVTRDFSRSLASILNSVTGKRRIPGSFFFLLIVFIRGFLVCESFEDFFVVI